MLTKSKIIDLNDVKEAFKCKYDVTAAAICKDVGDYYYKQSQYETALLYLKQACQLYKRKSDAFTFSRYPVFALAAFVRLGRTQYRLRQDDDAFESLLEAERQLNKEHAKPEEMTTIEYKEILLSYWSFAYDFMADCRKRYRLEFAKHKVELSRELLELNECEKYKWWLAIDLKDEGICYWLKREDDAAERCLLETVSILEPLIEQSGRNWNFTLACAYFHLGKIYSAVGKTESYDDVSSRLAKLEKHRPADEQ